MHTNNTAKPTANYFQRTEYYDETMNWIKMLIKIRKRISVSSKGFDEPYFHALISFFETCLRIAANDNQIAGFVIRQKAKIILLIPGHHSILHKALIAQYFQQIRLADKVYTPATLKKNN